MMTKNPIYFHWRLIQGEGEFLSTTATQNDMGQAAWPDLNLQGDFCKKGEMLGITSVLIDISYGKPDPVMLSMALTKKVKQMGFIIAIRSGLLSPTLFTQQINTLSTFTKAPIYLNVVAGYSPTELKYYGDYLSHNERYERTDDFLNICTKFWEEKDPVNVDGKYLKVKDGMLNTPYVSDKSKRPFIFIAGSSQPAIDLTLKYGDCWMQLADTLEKIEQKVAPVIAKGKSAGLRLSVICRPTNQEAMQAVKDLLLKSRGHLKEHMQRQDEYVAESDSQFIKESHLLSASEWLTPNLWTGAVRPIGPTSIAIVGSYEEVAERFMEYKNIGITHFILSGWSKLEEMKRFGKNVIPLIRKMEQQDELI